MPRVETSNGNSQPAPKGKAERKSRVDWDAVQIAYCTTRASTRVIGAAHGISHTAVSQRARQEGWQRPEGDAGAPASIPAPAPIPPQAGPGAVAPTPVQRESTTAQALDLSPLQQRFVAEYLIDLNGAQAAIRAGYSANCANVQASQLLARPNIQAAVSAARQEQQIRLQVSADTVLRKLALIATADPRELVDVKVGCCRHCHSEGHKRQRTVAEYNKDREAHRVKGKPDEEWDEEGGIGFDPLRPPHPECPECSGDGLSRTVLKDTRALSPHAAALYAGAKTGKNGIEVQMHSQMDALEKLARHLGMYEKDNHQKSDPLALRNMTDAERSVRMHAVLSSNPSLASTLAQLVGAGGVQ